MYIDLARDFCKFPGGRNRFELDGQPSSYSGQEFREVFLEPLLNQQKKITIELDGCAGICKAFYRGAFLDLYRKYGSIVSECITIQSARHNFRKRIADMYLKGSSHD